MSPRVLALSVLLALVGALTSGRAEAQRRVGAPAHPAATTTAPAPEGVVNINTASEDELVRLPGIGPARAAAIVALRGRVQRFRGVEDLARVRGIGRASVRRLRPYVTLTGETTLAQRPGRARVTAAQPAAEASNPYGSSNANVTVTPGPGPASGGR